MKFFIIVGIIFLLGIAVFFMFKPKASFERTVNTNESLSEEKKDFGGNTTTIKDEAKYKGTSIVYSDQGFNISSLALKQNTTGDGCLVNIYNKTASPLLIRLSPHDPKDAWGVQYPEIAAGQSAFIDPWYRIPKIAFHNHKNPAEEFSVTLGEGCSEF